MNRICLFIAGLCFALCAFLAFGDISMKWPVEGVLALGLLAFVAAHW